MHNTHRFMSSCTDLAGSPEHENGKLDSDVQQGNEPPLYTADTLEIKERDVVQANSIRGH